MLREEVMKKAVKKIVGSGGDWHKKRKEDWSLQYKVRQERRRKKASSISLVYSK